MLTEKCESELSPEVKYAYDNFLNAAINYFKTIDNNELIQSVYDNIWNRLDLILDISHTYFNLYFDYIQELLQFYLTLAEQHELYDVCINIKKLQDLFDKPSADLFS